MSLLTADPGSDLLGGRRWGGRFAPDPEALVSAHRRARVAQAMLGVHAGALVLAAVWYAVYPFADDRGVMVASALVYLLTAVAFATWKVTAYRLVPALGGEPAERTPGWAAGGYFIPIGNLWIPCQIMREIWDAGDPHAVDVDPWATRPAALLGVWWGLWIASGILSRVFDKLPVPHGSSAGYDAFAMVVWGLGLLVSGAAFLVVRRIDADQQALGARLLDARVGLDDPLPEAA